MKEWRMLSGEGAHGLADKANHVEPKMPSEELFNKIARRAEAGKYSLSVDGLPKEEAAWLADNGYKLTMAPSYADGVPDVVAEILW